MGDTLKKQSKYRQQKNNGESKAKIVVNGIETTVGEYHRNPDKFNKARMSKEYLEEVRKHSKKAAEDKKRLYVDPLTVKTII